MIETESLFFLSIFVYNWDYIVILCEKTETPQLRLERKWWKRVTIRGLIESSLT